jgi:uncharacterized protein YecE (DUF72 family)
MRATEMKQNDLRVGCMGFAYKEWVGPFYPLGTPSKEYLRRYSSCFQTVELDTTFYAPPRLSAVEKWRDDTPDDFTFAAKVWQRITHEKRFEDCGEDLGVHLRAMEPLGGKLGPLLLQCPPDLTIEALPAFEAFLRALPAGFRWAVEFRHRSWLVPNVYELLAEHNVCLVGADLYFMPTTTVQTADFLYIRLLGNRKQITEIGTVVRERATDVREWADRFNAMLPDADAGWVFANNHYSGFSPHTVSLMLNALGQPPAEFPVGKPDQHGVGWVTPSLF